MGNPAPVILAVNPGSTSTKVAVFEGEKLRVQRTLRHSPGELAGFAGVLDQKALRTAPVVAFLEEEQIPPLAAVVGRGGLLRPIPSGVYAVSEAMLADLATGPAGMHASSLGAVIAADLARARGIPAYIVDPVVVDEFEDEARLSGIPAIVRRSVLHALNQKAIARRAAGALGRPYEQLRLLVAHMGGGITVGAHCLGRVIDSTNAIDGEGTFSPERCGGVPLVGVIEMCYSGAHTREEMLAYTNKRGGLLAYLGTTDMAEAEAMAETDARAAGVLSAMAAQVAKDIGAMATVLEGRVDALVFTGGLAYSERFVAAVKKRAGFVAETVLVFPGEDEMAALAEGALRVLTGELEAADYAASVL